MHKMEIDPESLKKLVKVVYAEFTTLERELAAHRLLLDHLKEEMGLDLDPLLDSARNNPKVAEHVHEKCDVRLAKSLELLDTALAKRALSRRLKDWKPTGHIN